MHPRAARAPPTRRQAAAVPAPLPLPCRASRPPAKTAPTSRVELLLLACGLGKPLTGLNELGLRRVAPEAKADRRARFPIVQAKRAQYVARPARTARTGGTQ